MDYNELFEYLYEDLDKKNERFAGLSPLDRVTWRIIADLKDRRGFRQTWEELDEEIQDEIFRTHRAIIRATLSDMLAEV
jgi:hypothetical protein